MKIIFVCTGNTCRSPMAEGILKNLAPDLMVESRGIFVSPGTTTSGLTKKLLKERLDLELDHPARQISDEDCQSSDLILTMTQAQADFIRNLGECTQVYTLPEFIQEAGDIPDPFGGPPAAYERTYDVLMRLIKRALEKIRNDLGPHPEDFL